MNGTADHLMSKGRLRSSVLAQNRFSRATVWILLGGTLVLVGLGTAMHMLVTDIQRIRRLEFGEPQDRIAERYNQLLTDLRETERDRALLPLVRPTRENLVSFVQRLEAAAAAAGVAQTIEAIPKEMDHAGQPYASPVIRYRLTLDGPFPAITQFIAAMHTMPQLVRVEDIEITSAEKKDILATGIAVVHIAVAVRE